ASRSRRLDIAPASRAAQSSRLATDRFGRTLFDDGTQVIAPRGFDRDVDMVARDEAGTEPDRQRSPDLLQQPGRLALDHSRVDDGDRLQRAGDALPRPRRRRD